MVFGREENIEERKKALRRKAENRRNIASSIRSKQASLLLSNRFIDLFQDHLSSSLVSAYWPLPGEIDVRPLIYELLQREVSVLLPSSTGRKKPLVFRSWEEGVDLVDSGMGFMEPDTGATILSPDLLIVPLLGFDANCNRLGYGGGYYDKSLRALRQNLNICAVGVAYEEQEFCEIPIDKYDEPLDMVITDQRTLHS
ncbi:MAG: 5-formyltetrahydrofolate cyclo-ligase [Pseudomonadota bacterium]|nr:5-formyltetrahydrofolate cyclo-ligase [Pseudomonadota bacterium]